MIYENIFPAIFLERKNRFVALIYIDGLVEICHVKNTGRCKELLIPGVTIYVEKTDNPMRKTKYSLIVVEKNNELFNIDSQAPNKVLYEWFLTTSFAKGYKVFPEYTYGASRFDFLLENETDKLLIEVKGVTLEHHQIAYFPDAPTERGLKHVYELIEAKKEGFHTYILFVLQFTGAHVFKPNYITHKAFGDALIAAEKAGVVLRAVDTYVRANSLDFRKIIPIDLAPFSTSPFEATKKESLFSETKD